MTADILIAGVGGQGTVLASRILAEAALQNGIFARTAETIGMAQRGGSVVSHVRLVSEEKSPVIPTGRADLLIALEPAEAARNLCRLKKGGASLVNVRPIPPPGSSLRRDGYDEQAIREYLEQNSLARFADASAAAEACGDLRTLNVVMLAAAAALGLLPFAPEALRQAMAGTLPGKSLAVNQKAFDLGMNLF